MKTAKKILLSIVLLGAGFWLGTQALPTSANTAGNQPGSANDPLITKGYLDQHIGELVKAELAKQGGGAPGQGTPTDPSSDAKGLVIVELNPGHLLYASAGTEFILRNGKAVSVTEGTDGILDVTDGKDLRKGAMIPNNHLLLFPREDGRGITPHETETGTLYVMVRGAYLHLDADGNPVK